MLDCFLRMDKGIEFGGMQSRGDSFKRLFFNRTFKLTKFIAQTETTESIQRNHTIE